MKENASTVIIIIILVFGLGLVIGNAINNKPYVCRNGNLYERVSSIVLKDLKTSCILEME